MAFSDSDSPSSISSAGRGRQRPGGSAARRSPPSTSSPDVRAVAPSETSSLLNQLNDRGRPDAYEHGTFTPGLHSPSTGTDLVYPSDDAGDRRQEPAKGPSWRARLSRRVKSKKVRYSRALAREAGVESNKMM